MYCRDFNIIFSRWTRPIPIIHFIISNRRIETMKAPFNCNFIAQNGRKLKSGENKIRDIFIQCLAFNKTIIPLSLMGYLKAHIQRMFVE